MKSSEKRKIPSSALQEQLSELEERAGQRKVHIHYDLLEAAGLKLKGGICKIKGEYHIFVDRRKSTAEKIGLTFAIEAQTHVREEYSTFSWIMEGLLEQAGFTLDKADYKNDFMATYLCTKKS